MLLEVLSSFASTLVSTFSSRALSEALERMSGAGVKVLGRAQVSTTRGTWYSLRLALSNTPEATVLVSFVGMPALSEAHYARLPNPHPKILAVTAGPMELRTLFEREFPDKGDNA